MKKSMKLAGLLAMLMMVFVATTAFTGVNNVQSDDTPMARWLPALRCRQRCRAASRVAVDANTPPTATVWLSSIG